MNATLALATPGVIFLSSVLKNLGSGLIFCLPTALSISIGTDNAAIESSTITPIFPRLNLEVFPKEFLAVKICFFSIISSKPSVFDILPVCLFFFTVPIRPVNILNALLSLI